MNDNGDNNIQKDGFLAFVLKYVGIIAVLLAVGTVSAFTLNSLPTLLFTLVLGLVFFVILMFRYDRYKRGAMFTVTAVCVSVEHISASRTDYVFESIPEDETTEPQIFTLTTKRTKFKKYHQGVPYVMIFGMLKDCRELTEDNLVTASKKIEDYERGSASRGYINLDDLQDTDGSGSSSEGESAANAEESAAEDGPPVEDEPTETPEDSKVRFKVVSSSEREGGG